MVSISCRTILLDIEGTVAPVAFVYDVMFPFIRDNAGAYLHANWEDPDVQQAVALVGKDVGREDTQQWLSNGSVSETTSADQQQVVVDAVNELMDADAKVTGLKQLQGMIWEDGFGNGQLVSELFPDVLPKLKEWKSADCRLFIYSSGSIGAQKLFFGHTNEGNLLDMFSGYFDTTSGNKKESASYSNIAEQIGAPPESICFVSDVVAELDAAATVGMKTVLRPTGEVGEHEHPSITSFAELGLADLG